MATLFIRYGVNRQKPGAGRRRIEHNYGRLEIEGDWTDQSTHLAIRAKIREENPGWNITGYCDASPLTA